MKAILIDDEEKARENLANLLNKYCPEVKVQAKAGSIADAIQPIKSEKPDLVFLDIEMQGESGFDLFDYYPEPDFDVIFVTAHDEYAIRAFKFAAADYMLKPIDIDDLEHAVNMVGKREKTVRQEQLRQLITYVSEKSNAFNKIVLPTMESLLFVKVEQIVRCESDDNYTTVYLIGDKEILVSKNIKHFEDILESQGFYRIHRSHLVNLNYIKEYFRGDGGYVTMNDGSSIPVSRRKKTAFLERIKAM